MKNLFLILTVLFLSVSTVQGQIIKKVLFIGNSYTGVNNLPVIINNMAINTGDILIYDSNTPGGYRFMNHASNATTLNKINSNDWDYVALQAQSQETSWSQSQMETELYPFAESLSNSIRTNNECSQPLFYMTWGRENGDVNNCPFAPWVCTYEGMDDTIRSTYISMADTNDAEIAPVGAVWRYLRTNHPTIDLYSGDGSHPSLAGSYAAACAFYTMIYKKDPTLMTWNSTLADAEANTIKMATKTIVFDKIIDWDFTINPALADYTEVINTNEVVFTNTSDDFDNLLWDFGDGNTSTETNPTHTYATSGDYTVSLTVNKCGKSNIKSKTINVTTLGIEHPNPTIINIFPNPTSNNLTITLDKNYNDISVTFFDITGKSILKRTTQNVSKTVINLTNLSNGIYFMKIIADTKIYNSKISKR